MSRHISKASSECERHMVDECLKTTCFLCSERFEWNDELVVWMGSTGKISLHPWCATDLGCHLISDGVVGAQVESQRRRHQDMTTARETTTQ